MDSPGTGWMDGWMGKQVWGEKESKNTSLITFLFKNCSNAPEKLFSLIIPPCNWNNTVAAVAWLEIHVTWDGDLDGWQGRSLWLARQDLAWR